MSDDFALLAAIKRKVTSKSTPQNREYGLANITNFVRNHNGEVEIRSNYGVLISIQGEVKSYLSRNDFTGTSVIISFYKRYLPDIEEVFDDEEFYL
jgi:hypothetical protein